MNTREKPLAPWEAIRLVPRRKRAREGVAEVEREAPAAMGERALPEAASRVERVDPLADLNTLVESWTPAPAPLSSSGVDEDEILYLSGGLWSSIPPPPSLPRFEDFRSSALDDGAEIPVTLVDDDEPPTLRWVRWAPVEAPALALVSAAEGAAGAAADTVAPESGDASRRDDVPARSDVAPKKGRVIVAAAVVGFAVAAVGLAFARPAMHEASAPKVEERATTSERAHAGLAFAPAAVEAADEAAAGAITPGEGARAADGGAGITRSARAVESAPRPPTTPTPRAAAATTEPSGLRPFAFLDQGPSAFSTAAAAVALSSAARQASSCLRGEGDAAADVRVVFAPSGRASSATVSGPLAGTGAGACVARVFREANVPPFAGESVAVSRRVQVRAAK